MCVEHRFLLEWVGEFVCGALCLSSVGLCVRVEHRFLLEWVGELFSLTLYLLVLLPGNGAGRCPLPSDYTQCVYCVCAIVWDCH